MSDDEGRGLHEQIDDLRVRVDALAEQNATLIALVRELNERLTYREKILVGWKEIGQYLGMHAQSVYELGHAEVDPIPHRKDHRGCVIAEATALDAWKMRRARRLEEIKSDAAKAGAATRATRAGRAGRSALGDPS